MYRNLTNWKCNKILHYLIKLFYSIRLDDQNIKQNNDVTKDNFFKLNESPDG